MNLLLCLRYQEVEGELRSRSLISLKVIISIHIGHLFNLVKDFQMHFPWNIWPHFVILEQSLLIKPSRQIAQLSFRRNLCMLKKRIILDKNKALVLDFKTYSCFQIVTRNFLIFSARFSKTDLIMRSSNSIWTLQVGHCLRA